MAAKNDKTKKNRGVRGYIFFSLYALGFAGAFIIGFLGNSYFAYDVFNSLWADVLYLIFLSLLYITAFAEEVYDSRKPLDIIVNFFIYVVSLIFLLLSLLVSDAFVICMTIYSAILISFITINYVPELRKKTNKKFDTKQLVSAVSLILFSMLHITTIEFVNDMFIAWSLIPATIICCIASLVAFLMLKKDWNALLPTKMKRICYPLLGVFCIFAVSFMYSFTAVGNINCVFDGKPTPTEYVVLEKRITTGARQVTEFAVEVTINEKHVWIDVPVTDYHNLSEGDTVIVDYYNGALGFPYWKYAGTKQE